MDGVSEPILPQYCIFHQKKEEWYLPYHDVLRKPSLSKIWPDSQVFHHVLMLFWRKQEVNRNVVDCASETELRIWKIKLN